MPRAFGPCNENSIVVIVPDCKDQSSYRKPEVSIQIDEKNVFGHRSDLAKLVRWKHTWGTSLLLVVVREIAPVYEGRSWTYICPRQANTTEFVRQEKKLTRPRLCTWIKSGGFWEDPESLAYRMQAISAVALNAPGVGVAVVHHGPFHPVSPGGIVEGFNRSWIFTVSIKAYRMH